ncbi:hypothetical protein BpHYR1_049088 [Brachionus plicatilis]|uniref:Uncharacterized protein n=1 Tax=Brachionus plicatilis TaxID=10195 RepID=A0A3M7T8M9_BRAPC|nr:hypothetical protein BpHYR1_049088 [Brachionus plicatilis]
MKPFSIIGFDTDKIRIVSFKYWIIIKWMDRDQTTIHKQYQSLTVGTGLSNWVPNSNISRVGYI